MYICHTAEIIAVTLGSDRSVISGWPIYIANGDLLRRERKEKREDDILKQIDIIA